MRKFSFLIICQKRNTNIHGRISRAEMKPGPGTKYVLLRRYPWRKWRHFSDFGRRKALGEKAKLCERCLEKAVRQELNYLNSLITRPDIVPRFATKCVPDTLSRKHPSRFRSSSRVTLTINWCAKRSLLFISLLSLQPPKDTDFILEIVPYFTVFFI